MPSNSVSQPDEHELVTNDHAKGYGAAPCTSNSAASRIATVQLQLQSQIDILNADLAGFYERQKRDMLTQEQVIALKEKKKKTELENQLKKKKGDKKRAQKARDAKKRKLNELLEDNPELRKSLKVRTQTGRLRKISLYLILL